MDGLMMDFQLTLPHLPGGQAARREVRVEELAALRGGDPLRQTLRPPAVTTRAIRIVNALGRAVAERDVAGERKRWGGTHTLL